MHLDKPSSKLSYEHQAKRREDEARKARDAAAIGAHREVERMKLEEQRRKLEQVVMFIICISLYECC